MTFKRTTTTVKTVSVPDAQHRFASFVALLCTIDQRNAHNTPKNKRASTQQDDTKARTKSGPCFYWYLIYHVIITLALSIKINMIDTIAITLNSSMFKIIQPDKFTPSARWVENVGISIPGIKSKQNPTKKELKAGIYKPRLTMAHCYNANRIRDIMLRIELSLPKLLFGNNFDELQYKDFIPLTQKLSSTLESMGVIVSSDVLAQAPVCAIHYSKNIALTDGSIPFHYINKIKEANVKLSLDTNESAYRNDGHGYKWHCNAYEVAFYDKIKDLEKAKISSKLAIEKDSELQLSVVDALSTRNKFEVLRMEVRLNKREAIKKLLRKLNIKADLTFHGVFKPAIAKKVLLHYLDEIENKRPALLDYKPKNDQALLVALRVNNPELNHRQVFQLFGLKKALEIYTLRELRAMFGKTERHGWYRLMADVKKVHLPSTQNPLEALKTSIIQFKPTKLAQTKWHNWNNVILGE